MSRIEILIDKLAQGSAVAANDLEWLLSDALTPEEAEKLRSAARKLTDERFGNKVYLRGLLEITNVCRNNCYYCGLRRDNCTLPRYSLTQEEILATCSVGYDAGLRTFVLQGGENPALTQEKVVDIILAIKSAFQNVALTLSLGEWPDDSLEAFRRAGADRYLLRHETFLPSHYSALHPDEMSRDNRIRCLRTLKRLGFQTGTGIMVGTPGQTLSHIVADLKFMRDLGPEMIGIGPFIPQSDTPLFNHPAGSVKLTLRLISILRLLFPNANIPSTTALATLDSAGRNWGLMAGANVVMPNLTPCIYRKAYAIYDNKASTGADATEGISLLSQELRQIGLRPSFERGDYKTHSNNV